MLRRWPIFIFLFVAILTWAALEVYDLDESLQKRLSQGWFLPPTEFYSGGLHFIIGSDVDFQQVQEHLLNRDYRLRTEQDTLLPKDFAILSESACSTLVGFGKKSQTKSCFAIRPSAQDWDVIGIDDQHKVAQLWKGAALTSAQEISVAPTLMAQFYEGQPLFKEPTSLSSVPLECLQAVTAIEDTDFLKHKGVSFVGILRAIYRNLTAGHWAEGGSTITQQLVKNYFLTSKKTLKRKITEQVLAVLLEARTNKDTIFEQYLNVIFMGVSGPYQIRGFSSAARYYFGKNISQLGLPECALMAAMINSPGRYNPFEHPDHALKRRELVLQKMSNLDLISKEQMSQAIQTPLPAHPGMEALSPAPYFLQTAQRELDSLELSHEHGLRVITAFNSEFQNAANLAVRERVKEFESQRKSPAGLQIALISLELPSRHITAVVGGRSYQQTQFNRILDGYRQVGSTMKPFVYLTAMSKLDPLSERLDEPYTYEKGNLTWTPRNYDGKFRGPIPLFVGLAESLNVPAARTALDVGVDKIVENLHLAGLDKEIPLNPSLALGAFELSPWQLTQLYSTLGNFGAYQRIHSLVRVETLDGDTLWDESKLPVEQRIEPTPAAEVIGMMKTTPLIGTAQGLKNFHLPQTIAAKTGTTNDLKDAWFVGFTPTQLTIVWVGFDDNRPVGTGAGMALPVWADFHRRIASALPTEDFQWPTTTTLRNINLSDLAKKFPYVEELEEKATNLQLVFPKR
jgi:penicillin-binding protein 1B